MRASSRCPMSGCMRSLLLPAFPQQTPDHGARRELPGYAADSTRRVCARAAEEEARNRRRVAAEAERRSQRAEAPRDRIDVVHVAVRGVKAPFELGPGADAAANLQAVDPLVVVRTLGEHALPYRLANLVPRLLWMRGHHT